MNRASDFLTFLLSIGDSYKHGKNSDPVVQVPDLDPESGANGQQWEAGQIFAFIPKGTGVLLVPVPDRDALAGIAEGAATDGYRDRPNRL